MQKSTIHAIENNKSLILISPTGSGKTLAFLLPLLKIVKSDKEGVQVLIVVPTRELAIQIEKVFKQMGTAYKIISCYGGHAVGIEENNLLQPPTILVGTPGRIAHHLRRKNLDLSQTNTLILDEFDKSLEFGFKSEMEYIIQKGAQINQRILTSATALNELPSFIDHQAYSRLNYNTDHNQFRTNLVIKSVKVLGNDKTKALLLLIGQIGAKSTIVFCNHRDTVNKISEQLTLHQIAHGVYHGGMNQIDREKTLIKFRNGSIRLLITTDLAARGLDIPEIEAIIHYQMPATEDVLTHRNGRTARMNGTGTAYFLLDLDDHLPKFLDITPEALILPSQLILPDPVEWETLYIGAGKKDKINKMDIVGMLLQKGQLQKDELGKIEVLDYSAYAAIKSNKILKTLRLIKEEKIKNKKIKMEISS